MKPDTQRWMLSFYRHSEIQGSLFFGRLAQILPAGPLQLDLTRHYADEAQHARWWSECLDELELRPATIDRAYQDRYVEACGVPVNAMEILALTHVFEHRVVRQYREHRGVLALPEPVVRTMDRILSDEAWHLQWVRGALRAMRAEYGAPEIEATLARYRAADDEICARWRIEAAERIAEAMGDEAVIHEGSR